MKRNISLLVFLFILLLSASAQRVDFNLSFSPQPNAETVKVYVASQGSSSSARSMRPGEEGFSGVVPKSDYGFYLIVVATADSQRVLPVYAGDATEVSLNVDIEERSLSVDNTPQNRALSAINSCFAGYERRLWLEAGLSNDELKGLIESFAITADSVIAEYGVEPQVAEYINVWAYERAYNSYHSIPRAQNVDENSIAFALYDVLPEPHCALDNATASLFLAPVIIEENFPQGLSLMEKLDILYTKYENPVLRENVAAFLLNRFITGYDYSSGLESGIEQINAVVEKFGLSQEFATEFMKRKTTVAGAEFPADVVLVDSTGNVVEFSSFKGKYVYIDMWASWCGPCCREVPFLQELEASLQNEDVVFVSISIDSDPLAWKHKMVELSMHGNQLYDRDAKLGTALNVRGIPFFLLYDKEGRLHTYGAPRPSSGEELRTLLEGLH